MLRLAPPIPVAHCMPWHARSYELEPVHAARCCHCGRDIARPESARGKLAACIYCGLDRGEIPWEEPESR